MKYETLQELDDTYELPAPEDLARSIGTRYRALGGPGFPEDGLCSVIGITFDISVVSCFITAAESGHVRIGVYMIPVFDGKKLVVEEQYWLDVATALTTQIGRTPDDVWNAGLSHSGGEFVGGNGASFVYDDATDDVEGLARAIENYRNLDEPWNVDGRIKGRFDRFRKWYQGRLDAGPYSNQTDEES